MVSPQIAVEALLTRWAALSGHRWLNATKGRENNLGRVRGGRVARVRLFGGPSRKLLFLLAQSLAAVVNGVYLG